MCKRCYEISRIGRSGIRSIDAYVIYVCKQLFLRRRGCVGNDARGDCGKCGRCTCDSCKRRGPNPSQASNAVRWREIMFCFLGSRRQNDKIDHYGIVFNRKESYSIVSVPPNPTFPKGRSLGSHPHSPRPGTSSSSSG